MLELFTSSDRFGDVERRHAGILTEPGFECKIMMMRDSDAEDLAGSGESYLIFSVNTLDVPLPSG